MLSAEGAFDWILGLIRSRGDIAKVDSSRLVACEALPTSASR